MKTTRHFYYISLFLLRMRNISHKMCGGNQNTYFTFINIFIANRAFMR